MFVSVRVFVCSCFLLAYYVPSQDLGECRALENWVGPAAANQNINAPNLLILPVAGLAAACQRRLINTGPTRVQDSFCQSPLLPGLMEKFEKQSAAIEAVLAELGELHFFHDAVVGGHELLALWCYKYVLLAALRFRKGPHSAKLSCKAGVDRRPCTKLATAAAPDLAISKRQWPVGCTHGCRAASVKVSSLPAISLDPNKARQLQCW